MGGFLSACIRGPVCFGFPGYMTFKAVRTGQPQAQNAWLKYWAVLGILLFIEFIMSFVLFWVPGYNLMFTAVFVGMAWPQSTLTGRLFKALEPEVSKREPFLDSKIRGIDSEIRKSSLKLRPYLTQAEEFFDNLYKSQAPAQLSDTQRKQK
eukprot:CAMPEP_0198727258 /NCGR_PEP_ID=MMETSP1475-20131203/4041_1 /TAXON_ID= ORGANISM="Unidentified sp., Strain CCMP1999" /NCGR_SAMPLE_ID=MMETSP1475 /ASSEMBLY_ACC=CAM_ASM_001111 /LENGTH=150 /DNA_ID=CAMNT_0044489269 /DNA_START=113 /DNA_END=565 /DNA_ORIENTATION=-